MIALTLKAPYCIAPAKLKELKAQLEELLEKRFICPSSLCDTLKFRLGFDGA